MTKIRTRFAPSPTGFLHIGGLRTALFAYLLAKSQGGKFILRIEDTDRKREVEGAQKALRDVLEWTGIKIDEGPGIGGEYGSYIQSERQELYKKRVNELLVSGHAYHCFCTPDRLQDVREKMQQEKKAPKYDRCCRDLSAVEVEKRVEDGESYVIRQKMPLDGEVRVYDEIRGEIVFQASELEDHVLIKSDGVPTYQFAVVVDDHEMEISHVVRGEEWIPSFPKNILLYQAFNWKPPKFIHPGGVLNKEGGKLSKRQGDVSVEDFRAKGYLREAIINFIVLLGWHPKNDNELFTIKQLEKEFKSTDIRSSGSIFDIDKLDYFNAHYIRQKSIDELYELCSPYLEKNIGLSTDKRKTTSEFIKSVISLEQERMKKISDISDLTRFFFLDKLEYPKELLIWKKLELSDVKNNLEELITILEEVSDKEWNSENLEKKIISYIKDNNKKTGDYLWPMRVALTGERASPSPFDVAGVLGREESLGRIKKVKEL